MLTNLSVIVSGLLLTGCPTDPSLTLLCDARYDLSHGWGHVFRCRVKDVLSGELDDTVIYVSVYGTVELYGDLLLPFKDYENLILGFTLDTERNTGPPPGFRDSEGNYWDLKVVLERSSITLSTLPSLSDVCYGGYGFPEWAESEGDMVMYEYDSSIVIDPRKPDLDRWIAGLEKIEIEDYENGFIKGWFEGEETRYVLVFKGPPFGGEFYVFNGDTIDMASPIDTNGILFITQVGIYKWRYIYHNDLLRKRMFYRTNTLSPIWAVDSIEYWPDSDIPRYIYRYEEPDEIDISDDTWDTRTVHDSEGVIIRKEAREGDILWEKKIP